MVWFKVDDKLHSHPKTSNASLAAIGLWTLAGSWCGDHTTDGRVTLAMVQSLSRGAIELADELVAAGFWVRTRNGYRFHQWVEDSDGTKRNPSKKEVEEQRRKKAEAGRKGGLASGKTRSKRQASAKARASPLVEPPTRPSPSKEGSGGERAAPLGAPLAPANPATHSPPNGEIPDPERRSQLAAEARAAIRRPPRRSRDPLKPSDPVPDKGQAALARLDAALAKQSQPGESQPAEGDTT